MNAVLVSTFARTNTFRMLWKHSFCQKIRSLYSPASLGVEDYRKYRQKYDMRGDYLYLNKFQEKMRDYCSGNDPSSMIFTEDLKQFTHVMSDSEEQLSLVMQMMEKFHQQNAQLRFGSYNFGPVVMRMYYHFNKPDEALQAYKNPKLEGFFDHLSAHVILFDLLFINEKYEEIIELYDKLKKKQLFFGKYPRSLIILVLASCYKRNSEEMFKYAISLWKEMKESGVLPVRRAACYLGALALKQNSPHIALEIMSALTNQHFVLVRSIKACSFCALGRIEDVIIILRSVLTFDAPNIPKQTFPVDVFQTIKDAVEKENNKELSAEFSRIEKQLQRQNHISDKTLDELLFAEITISKPVKRDQSVLRAAFNGAEDTSFERNRWSNYFRRPGLSDMS